MLKQTTVVKPQIVNSVGEIVREEVSVTFQERANSRFRSITDLKGFSDNELIVEPSKTDTTGYVDNRVVIEKIMRNTPLDILSIYTDKAFHDEIAAEGDEITDEDFEFCDHLDEFDIVTESGALSEAIAEASSGNETKNPIVEPKVEGSVATETAG